MGKKRKAPDEVDVDENENVPEVDNIKPDKAKKSKKDKSKKLTEEPSVLPEQIVDEEKGVKRKSKEKSLGAGDHCEDAVHSQKGSQSQKSKKSKKASKQSSSADIVLNSKESNKENEKNKHKEEKKKESKVVQEDAAEGKKKKKKEKRESAANGIDIATPESIDDDIQIKKKKKDKHKQEKGADEPVQVQSAVPSGETDGADDAAPSKKDTKKKKEKEKKSKRHQSIEEEKEIVDAPTSAGKDPISEDNNEAAAHANGAEAMDPSASGTKAFQRVKADEWLGKKGSWNNSYEATFGQGGWGFKAQQVLGAVRGKDFRHEKTKKKRGSYIGGLIDPSARCSYKFDSDGES